MCVHRTVTIDLYCVICVSIHMASTVLTGELTAYCMGPTKVAHCELEDHHDGTFRLIVRPQEVGRHVLQVKYGGEHVLGECRKLSQLCQK